MGAVMRARSLILLVALCPCLIVPPAARAAGRVIDLAEVGAPVLNGDAEEGQFGYSVALGDVDGDGDRELIVGAPGREDTSSAMHVGAVYLFRAARLETLSLPAAASGAADLVLEGAWPRGRFGSSLAVADFDGDGEDDLAAGAPAAGDGADLSTGLVAVYLRLAEAFVAGERRVEPDLVILGAWSGGRFGSAVSAGDVDGDGINDLVVAAPRAGAPGGRGPGTVYVFDGALLGATRGEVSADEMSAASVTGEKPGDLLAGISVADTDGDGDGELLLGAYGADGEGPELVDAGRLYAIPATPLLERKNLLLPDGAAVTVDGLTTRAYFGRAISSGDVDYDGIDDVLVSAYASRLEQPKIEASGEAFVLFGSSDGLTAPLLEGDTPNFTSGDRWDLFGLPVLLEDLNGDAASDLLMAAQFADGPESDREDCGKIYIFWGSLRSVVAAKAGSPELADVTLVGISGGDRLGGSLVASDFIGGRSPDIVVGAPDSAGASGNASPGYGRVVIVPGELVAR
jgi:hypothetical protein